MRIFDIAVNDLRQVVRDRRAALFLLIMPLAFTLLFGFAFGGFSVGGNVEDLRLPVAVIDLDENAHSAALITLIDQSAVVRIVPGVESEAELERQVSDSELVAGIIIPSGYRAQASSEDPIELIVIAEALDPAANAVINEIDAIAERIVAAGTSARITAEIQDAHIPFSDGESEQMQFDEMVARVLAGWQSPPVVISLRGAGNNTEQAADDGTSEVYGNNAFSQSSPGMMAQFAIAGLMGAAGVLVTERKSRSLRRLLTTPISRAEILLGHYLAMFVLIFAQLFVLILFGQLFLRLNYFSEPLAILLIVFTTALFCASLGLLIGAVARKDEHVVVLALIPMFLLAALGGAWVPLEFTPPAFQQIAVFTPLALMIDGLKDILLRGLGTPDVLPAAILLLGYAAVLFVVAVWRFQYE